MTLHPTGPSPASLHSPSTAGPPTRRPGRAHRAQGDSTELAHARQIPVLALTLKRVTAPGQVTYPPGSLLCAGLTTRSGQGCWGKCISDTAEARCSGWAPLMAHEGLPPFPAGTPGEGGLGEDIVTTGSEVGGPGQLGSGQARGPGLSRHSQTASPAAMPCAGARPPGPGPRCQAGRLPAAAAGPPRPAPAALGLPLPSLPRPVSLVAPLPAPPHLSFVLFLSSLCLSVCLCLILHLSRLHFSLPSCFLASLSLCLWRRRGGAQEALQITSSGPLTPSPSRVRWRRGSWDPVGLGGLWGHGSPRMNEAEALCCAPRARAPGSQLSLTTQGSSIQQTFLGLCPDAEPWLQVRRRRREAETPLWWSSNHTRGTG